MVMIGSFIEEVWEELLWWSQLGSLSELSPVAPFCGP